MSQRSSLPELLGSNSGAQIDGLDQLFDDQLSSLLKKGLSLSESVHYFGVPRKEIKRRIREGTIPAVRVPGPKGLKWRIFPEGVPDSLIGLAEPPASSLPISADTTSNLEVDPGSGPKYRSSRRPKEPKLCRKPSRDSLETSENLRPATTSPTDGDVAEPLRHDHDPVANTTPMPDIGAKTPGAETSKASTGYPDGAVFAWSVSLSGSALLTHLQDGTDESIPGRIALVQSIAGEAPCPESSSLITLVGGLCLGISHLDQECVSLGFTQDANGAARRKGPDRSDRRETEQTSPVTGNLCDGFLSVHQEETAVPAEGDQSPGTDKRDSSWAKTAKTSVVEPLELLALEARLDVLLNHIGRLEARITGLEDQVKYLTQIQHRNPGVLTVLYLVPFLVLITAVVLLSPKSSSWF